MKKLIALTLLLCTFALLLSSCSVYPSLETWYISSVQYDKTFVNGQVGEVLVYTYPREYCPIAVHHNMTYIKSRWDGKLVFKPLDSDEELVGTYIHTLNGNIIIYFDNGEQTTSGRASFSYPLGGPELPEYHGSFDFTFRGIRYRFSTNDDRDHIPKDYELVMKEFAEKIRNGDYSLEKGTINGNTLTSTCYGVISFNLFAENTKLTAVQITAANKVIMLDELKDGECYFYSFINGKYSSYVIYYID